MAVELRQCHRLGTVPEVSGTVELDDRVVTPRVHFGLAALANPRADHVSVSRCHGASPGDRLTREDAFDRAGLEPLDLDDLEPGCPDER